MRKKSPRLIFSFVYSLTLHVVGIMIILLFSPTVYTIGGNFPFVMVRLYHSFPFFDKGRSTASIDASMYKVEVYLSKNTERPERAEKFKAAQHSRQKADKTEQMKEAKRDVDENSPVTKSANLQLPQDTATTFPAVKEEETDNHSKEEPGKTDEAVIGSDRESSSNGKENIQIPEIVEGQKEKQSVASEEIALLEKEDDIKTLEQTIEDSSFVILTPESKIAGNEAAKMEPDMDSGTKGIIILPEPPIYGDLKLEITTEGGSIEGLKITVLYKEFLKNRRDRPLARSEAGRTKKIETKLINRGDSSLIAVIEKIDEGIYDFMVEFDKSPVKVNIVLRLYEESSGGGIKNIGMIDITHKTLIAKILMPEGILWDDESYFSGYIEDFDSITKFNTPTGLVWREFKE